MELKCRATFGVLLYCNNGEGGKSYQLDMKNYVSKYIISKKKKRFLEICEDIFYGIDVTRHQLTFKDKIGYVILDFIVPPKHHSSKYHIFKNAEHMTDLKSMTDEIIKSLIDQYGDWSKKQYIGNGGPDTWMSGDIMIVNKNEIDNSYYEVVPSFYKLEIIDVMRGSKKPNRGSKSKSKGGKRKGPIDSAKLFKIGTKKKGIDGNMWIIVTNKNGIKRWKKNV